MDRVNVKSSTLKSIGYDGGTKTLEIEFIGGSVYEYSGIEQHSYTSLLKAKSKGKYFSTYIRNGTSKRLYQ